MLYPVAALKPVKPFMSRLKKVQETRFEKWKQEETQTHFSKRENYFTTRRKDGASKRGVGGRAESTQAGSHSHGTPEARCYNWQENKHFRLGDVPLHLLCIINICAVSAEKFTGIN